MFAFQLHVWKVFLSYSCFRSQHTSPQELSIHLYIMFQWLLLLGQHVLLVQTATNCFTWQTIRQFCLPLSEKKGQQDMPYHLSSLWHGWLDLVASKGRCFLWTGRNWREAGEVPECCGCSSLSMMHSPSHWVDELDHAFITSFCIFLLQSEFSTGCLLGARRLF